MPPSAAWRRTLQKFCSTKPLTYVDVGARRGRVPRWAAVLKNTRYVGFEADAAESARLQQSAKPGHTYVAAAVGRTNETRTFHVTANPACASLLEPNLEFLQQFEGLAPQFQVQRSIEMTTRPLDACLAEHAIDAPDFLELDTQGSELDILQGAARALREHIAGVQVEVEFAEMYLGQPLFADIDADLRARGFQLVDLSLYRGRRRGLDDGIATRGQLLWGHAIYLRDHAALPEERATRIGVLAALLDMPDLSHQVFTLLHETADSRALREASGRLAAMAGAAPQVGGRMGLRARAERLRAAAVRALQPDALGRRLAASRGKATWRD
jgi:FkbM family methyltransferase